METQQVDLFKSNALSFSWDNFLTPTPCETAEELQSELAHYIRLGMKEPAREVHLRLMALATEQKGLLMLSVQVWGNQFWGFRPLGDNEPTVSIIASKGSEQYLSEMRYTPLAKYNERVPMNILDKLPTRTGKAVVFSKSRDPIIAVPICRRKKMCYFLGIHKWE